MARPRKSIFDQVLAEAGLEENLPPEQQTAHQTEAPVAEASIEEPSEEPVEEPLHEGGVVEPPVETSTDMGEEAIVPEEEHPMPSPKASAILQKMFQPVFRVSSAESPQAIEDMAPLTADERTMLLRSRLKEVLCVPKQKGQLPTLVRFRQEGQVPLRAVIVEIGEIELQKGWELYKSFGDNDPEKYLLMMYDLTQHEIPRLYRTVAEMRLE